MSIKTIIKRKLQEQEFLRQMQWASGTLETISSDGEITYDAMPLEASHWCQYHNPEDVANFITWYRGKAKAAVALLPSKESRVAEAFLSAAQLALADFNITTHAHKVLSKTTVRFREMKEGKQPVNISIVIDSTRIDTQSKIAALLQTCALMEFQRCQNSNPVYIIADECNSYKIEGLMKLLSYNREYGIRLFLIIQTLSFPYLADYQDCILLDYCEY